MPPQPALCNMDAPAKPALLGLLPWRLGRSQQDLCEAGQETTRLFEVHQSPVWRYLRSFGLTTQDCDEVVQETFFSLFLHLRAGKPRDNLTGWIFRVAHNQGLKCRGRNSAERLAVLDPLWAAQFPDPDAGAEQRLLLGERYKRLRAVVQALDEQERQCLFLRAEGLRYREIAGTLGVSVGTVASLLTRALDRLRRAGGALD